MRVSVVFMVAGFVALSGCARPNYPAPETRMGENVVVTASPDAIRAVETDLRRAIEDRRSDAGADISLNEYGGPPPKTVDADPHLLNAAVDDARRKARALANAVHATLGDVIAVDEVNAADPSPRYGAGPERLKGVSLSRVTVNADAPEIVRVTFALSSRGRGPGSVTVYGLQATRPTTIAPVSTQLTVGINASGDDALKTVTAWETIVRDSAHRHGVREADIRAGMVNASFPRRPR